jgi:hypothetical protein
MSARRGPFAKVYRSLWYGSLARRPDECLTFLFLLTHADAGGVVDVTPEVIAAQSGLPLDVWAATLEAPDHESRSRREGGAQIVRLDPHRSWGGGSSTTAYRRTKAGETPCERGTARVSASGIGRKRLGERP